MKRLTFIIIAVWSNILFCFSETVEPIKFGDFNSWVTRNIKESSIIGGKNKALYEIGPAKTIDGNKAYANSGGSPWATSNVYAKVMGIAKGSNGVFPDIRKGNDKCVKLTTIMERCKAVGIVNIDVLVAGSIFLGEMIEPVTSTSNPYSKMEFGIKFNRRPKALQFDYKLLIPEDNTRIYSSGFGKKKTLKGHENADVFIFLQRRWEDSDGKIHAKRVGTGRMHFNSSTSGWVNAFNIPILYGDITSLSEYKPYMGIIPEDSKLLRYRDAVFQPIEHRLKKNFSWIMRFLLVRDSQSGLRVPSRMVSGHGWVGVSGHPFRQPPFSP